VIASVIVACRNEIRDIRCFLDSVIAQSFSGVALEVIVADGMSHDGTRQVLQEYARVDERIRVIDNPGRIVSTGLNAAIRLARGEIIVRMDAHTDYAPDYIRRCLEVLEETGADNVGGPARTRASGWLGRAVSAAYHNPFGSGGARFHDEDFEGYVDTVIYGCWRKTTLERLGLFDEALVRNQDDELNLRLVLSGGSIFQSPRIVSWLRTRESLSALFRQYFQYGFWKVAVIRKHRTTASWRHLVPGGFVATNLALLTLASWAAAFGPSSLFRVSLLIWGTIGALYLASSIAASFWTARRSGWSVFPLLPLVFATYHVAYGLGFLKGLLYRPGSCQPQGTLAESAR
jgi:succinoglycan biosynthesis protein ExoA